MMTAAPIPDRLALIDTLTLDDGAHAVDDPDAAIRDGQACVMEAVSWVAGEPWSDAPECASPVLAAYLRSWNDALPDDERQRLRQYVPRLVGSRGTAEQENARSWMALDWLVRVHTPAWLRLAGLDGHADRLAGLDELRAGMDVPSTRPLIDAWNAARLAAGDAAAWVAAWDAAWDTAVLTATTAAGDAAWDAAARVAAGDAAAWDAAAWDAARIAAAGAAARVAAGRAAGDALRPTRDHLIESSHHLVDRMLAVTEREEHP